MRWTSRRARRLWRPEDVQSLPRWTYGTFARVAAVAIGAGGVVVVHDTRESFQKYVRWHVSDSITPSGDLLHEGCLLSVSAARRSQGSAGGMKVLQGARPALCGVLYYIDPIFLR